MRWFVEVSRVGESGLSEKYCVEAKQWQAALQEARKLRGDSGALSKFSIELLDDGYRAVDPSLKLRYLVNKAPGDAPLTPHNEEMEAAALKTNGRSLSLRPSAAPTAFASASPGAAPATDISTKVAAGGVPRPTAHSQMPPRPSGNAPRPISSTPPRPHPQLVVPEDPVPPAPRAPTGVGFEPVAPAAVAAAIAPVAAPVVSAPAPVAVAAPIAAPAPVGGAAPVAPQAIAATAPVAVAPSIAPAESLAAAAVPAFQVVRERAEEPRAESPITYREVAYAVEPGTSRAQVEALLWARYKEVAAAIEERPTGKFVQLAVFDHVFQKRPERPPLATFAWKDWRGAPMLAFPGFGEPAQGPLSQVPPSVASMPPAAMSVPPAPAAPVIASEPPPAPAPVVIAPPPVVIAPAPIVVSAPPAAEPAPLVPTPVVPQTPAAAPEPAPVVAAPTVVAAEPAPVVAAPSVAAPAPAAPAPAADEPAPSAPVAIDITFDSSPVAARKSSPDPERQSRPRLATPGRRRAGEDLIGELFEYMHELHFMRDVAAGAEFVLSIVNEVLPCEGVLIHVFDINTNHFVVVRAKGPNAKEVLLQRMSDQDPFAQWVMRSPQAVSSKHAASDPRFNAPRWQALGVAPKYALAGAVRQGGRYLGLIELVNPSGDSAFHQSEVNALDYIGEQFAEFLSNRPIIVAADVILAKH